MKKAAGQLSSETSVSAACEALAVPRSSYYRARQPKQAARPRPTPQRALSQEEKVQVRETLNSERFQDSSPREVYATLLDESIYLCSWRTMYRVLEEHQEVRERRNQLRHPVYNKPELLATGPNQLWSWDGRPFGRLVNISMDMAHYQGWAS
jgi:putative transposase